MTTTSEQPGMDSPELARKMWRTLEPYHGIVYFTPHAEAAYAALGIHGRDGYFASRAAPLGAVKAELVISTFYNFHPALIRHAIPAVWAKATPEAILAARLDAADLALRELVGEAVESEEMGEAAAIAERAARAAPIEGRPLFAGHAALEWPERPHLVLWHAIALLREFRGDGHIAALVVAGLDPVEALITHGASADSPFDVSVLRRSRAWPDDEWEAGRARLRDRGLLEGDRLSEKGEALRSKVEQETDAAAAVPWRSVPIEDADRLRALVRPWSRAIVESGSFGLR